MKDNPFEQAKAFDRLEELVARGASPDDPAVGDLCGELEVVQLLLRYSENVELPKEELFRRQVMGKLRKRRHWATITTLSTLAAAVLIAFFLYRAPKVNPITPNGMIVGDKQVANALETLTRNDMIAFLNTAESLLMSIRDNDESCSEEGADMALERQTAEQLLIQQKRFVSQLNEERYNQARHLFASLESILVDVKNLDSCTDPLDVEIINEHISNKRILGKLRLIAQEIQVS